MKQARRVGWPVLVVLLVGCTFFESSEKTFLRKAENRATQAEVQERLGPPGLTVPSDEGSVWVYQVWSRQPGNWAGTVEGTYCEEYALRFDRREVLRDYSQKTEFHRGAGTPGHCVRDGFVPPR